MPALPIPELDAEFAAHFTRAKTDMIETGDHGCTIVQTGAALLPETAAIPWPTMVTDEPLIEMFVVDDAGQCLATGDNAEVIAAWRPAAEALARQVLDAAAAHGISLGASSYLTASVTPADQVTTLPHYDDDMLMPGDGVGFVAIAGGLDGPRVASGTIEHAPVRAPSQLQLAETDADALAAGTCEHQVAPRDRIVVFPQFGQLHSGPLITDPDPTEMRYLLVFRSATTPR